jgi:hypothetical protein
MSDVRDEQVKAVLMEAAKLVERESQSPTRAIKSLTELDPSLWDEAVDAVCKHVGVDDFVGLIHWNASPGRTQAEVVAALRGAAESVEKEAKP